MGWWYELWERLRTRLTGVPPYAGIQGSWWWNEDNTPPPETYDRLYRLQPHVQTVVNFIAINLAQLGVKVYRRVADDDRVEVHNHPLAILLRQPNPQTTRYRFIAELVTDFCVDGNAYAVKIPPPTGGLELYRVPPAQIRHSGNDLLGRMYTWSPGAGLAAVNLSPAQVVHLRQPREISPLEALRQLLAEDTATTAYRSRFWQNYARLGGVIQRPAGAPRWTPDQRKSFRKSWRAYQGPQGSGKTVVLEDGMTYSQISATAEQSQLVQSRKFTREEVAAAYHVPPAMIGVVESQGYGSLREQHKALYQDTLGPYIAMLEGDFQLQLLSDFVDDDVYIEFNINEKMQGSFEEQSSALGAATGTPYMSVNEARARLNLTKLSDPAYRQPVVRLDLAQGQQQRAASATTNGTNGTNGNGAGG
jgi:HK97 family phage portal protein